MSFVNQRNELAWYIDGNNIGIVEADTGLSVKKDLPEEILLEYIALDLSYIIDEDTDIPVNENTKNLLVYWMRHKYFEYSGDEQRSQYYKRMFNEFINDLRKTYNQTPVRPLHLDVSAALGYGDD